MGAITKDMRISSVISEYPETWFVFARHGMGCCGCMGALDESIETGARMHSIDLAGLLSELNEVARPSACENVAE